MAAIERFMGLVGRAQTASPDKGKYRPEADPTRPEYWDGYPLYKWFTGLSVYRQSLGTTLGLVTSIPDCLAADFGCGVGTALPGLLARSGAARILAVDFSPKMLKEAGREAQRTLKRPEYMAKEIEVARMDISKPSSWGEILGDRKLDIAFNHIVVCWQSDEQREVFFEQAGRYVKPSGVLVTGFRNEKWNPSRVGGHVKEELIRSGLACVGALAAKGHTNAVEDAIVAGLTASKRPTLEEVISLADRNGFDVDRVEKTFWPEDPEGAAGNAIRFIRRRV